MNVSSFYTFINHLLITYKKKEPTLFTNSFSVFSQNLKNIFDDSTIGSKLKMTRITILFEGFYAFLPLVSDLKNEFLKLREKRWLSHYGTPPLSFLLTYKTLIQTFTKQFKENSPTLGKWLSLSPLEDDVDNNVLVNTKAISNVPMPEEEVMGQFLKTYNPLGGFTTAPCDPYSQEFIEYAASIAKKEGQVLEIGAGFGAASLRALAQGANVFCNDIDPQNLAVVHNRYLKMVSNCSTITGDTSKLVLIPGAFPEELSGLPKNFFDAILICRLLHFFPGKKIESGLKQIATLLKPGGKLFIVCETPFLKNWQKFLPEYEERLKKGVDYPGEITTPEKYESSGRSASLPAFVHWITKEILERTLLRTTLFTIDKSSYINRKNQFPPDLLWNGEESVGAIAIKLEDSHGEKAQFTNMA